MAGFQARLNALEGQYAHEEQRLALTKHLERLVRAGQVSAEAVAAMKERAARELTTTVISRPAAEQVYQHVKGAFPTVHLGAVDAWAQLGTKQISLGRARWETSGGSIFSVADGRRLAQEPVRLPTAFEAARQRKIERAVTETPLADEASGRLREVLTPYIEAVAATLAPLKGQLQFAALREATESSEFGELARRLRRSLGGPERA